ncbi:hypothetical protein EON64_07110 [archaeon]|nr:MAG: hypothetical protein EON64_07110 [archaeon]
MPAKGEPEITQQTNKSYKSRNAVDSCSVSPPPHLMRFVVTAHHPPLRRHANVAQCASAWAASVAPHVRVA